MSFQVGDLVFVFRSAATQTCNLTGKIGLIKHIKGEGGEYVGVEFSENVGGHELQGHCLKPFGYYMRATVLQKMVPLATLVRQQWTKEWEPKLKNKKEEPDFIVLLE